MTTQYWLVKSDPDTYGWSNLVRDQRTDWTGVRNFQARNHLKGMQPGDSVLFYESGAPKSVVGIAEVTKSAFPDTTADEPGWVAVELKAVKPLARPVTLEQIKGEPSLSDILLVRHSRLSVMPLPADAYKTIVKFGS